MDYALGILVSLIVEGVKRQFGTSSFGTYLTLAGIALVGGTFYTFAADTAWWPTFMHVVLASQTFYALLLSQFKAQA